MMMQPCISDGKKSYELPDGTSSQTATGGSIEWKFGSFQGSLATIDFRTYYSIVMNSGDMLGRIPLGIHEPATVFVFSAKIEIYDLAGVGAHSLGVDAKC